VTPEVSLFLSAHFEVCEPGILNTQFLSDELLLWHRSALLLERNCSAVDLTQIWHDFLARRCLTYRLATIVFFPDTKRSANGCFSDKQFTVD
jgi:hypothetical protein